MPTQLSEEPLTITTVKLYQRDVDFLKARYGYGWSGKVRSLVRIYIRELELERQNVKT